MTGRETIGQIIKDQNKTVAEFAKSCGLSTAAMWERLYGPKQKDIPLSTFNDMLRVLGYKILVVPFSARATNGSYYVDCVMTPETAAKVKEKLERKSQKSSPAKKTNATEQPVEQPTNASNEFAPVPAIEPTPTEPTEASPVNDEDVYVPTKEELEEYEKELQKLNEWRKSQGLPEIDLSKSSDEENATDTSEDYLDDELPW